VRVRPPTRHFHVPSAVRASPYRIAPEEARELAAQGALVIDVRRHDDHVEGMEGALRISPDLIPSRIGGFARDTPIVLGCT
jgi:rhodanese-related sulfurtransferase